MAKKTEGEEEQKVETITVKSAQAGKVGVWELDDAHKAAGHETGEVFVSDKPVKVAKTPRVMNRLHDGLLVEV